MTSKLAPIFRVAASQNKESNSICDKPSILDRLKSSGDAKKIAGDVKNTTECVKNCVEDHVKPPIRDGNKRGDVRSASAHFSSRLNKNLIEKLLADSENGPASKRPVFSSSGWSDWSEATFGCTDGTPRSLPHPSTPRSKTEATIKKNRVSSQKSVRWVNNGLECQLLCPWQASVDPVTYCYIPDNGSYRNTKSILAAAKNNKESKSSVRRCKANKDGIAPETPQVQNSSNKDTKQPVSSHSDLMSDHTVQGSQSTDLTQSRESAVKRLTRQTHSPRSARPVQSAQPRQHSGRGSSSDKTAERLNRHIYALTRPTNSPPKSSYMDRETEALVPPGHVITKRGKRLVLTAAHPRGGCEGGKCSEKQRCTSLASSGRQPLEAAGKSDAPPRPPLLKLTARHKETERVVSPDKDLMCHMPPMTANQDLLCDMPPMTANQPPDEDLLCHMPPMTANQPPDEDLLCHMPPMTANQPPDAERLLMLNSFPITGHPHPSTSANSALNPQSSAPSASVQHPLSSAPSASVQHPHLSATNIPLLSTIGLDVGSKNMKDSPRGQNAKRQTSPKAQGSSFVGRGETFCTGGATARCSGGDRCAGGSGCTGDAGCVTGSGRAASGQLACEQGDRGLGTVEKSLPEILGKRLTYARTTHRLL